MDMHVGMELPGSMDSAFVVRSTAEKVLERNMETHQTLGDPAWRTEQARSRHTHREAGPGSGWSGNLMLARVRESVALDLGPCHCRGCWVSNRGMSPIQTFDSTNRTERIQ